MLALELEENSLHSYRLQNLRGDIGLFRFHVVLGKVCLSDSVYPGDDNTCLSVDWGGKKFGAALA